MSQGRLLQDDYQLGTPSTSNAGATATMAVGMGGGDGSSAPTSPKSARDQAPSRVASLLNLHQRSSTTRLLPSALHLQPSVLGLGSATTSTAVGLDESAHPMASTAGNATATIHDVEAWNAAVQVDPTALIPLLPRITEMLERYCLSHPSRCLGVWESVYPALLAIHAPPAPSAAPPTRPPPPYCPPIPYVTVNVHGEEREDGYAWLNERENPRVLEYIAEENMYAEEMLADTKPLQKLLYREFVSRLDEEERSPAVTLVDGNAYYSKRVPGKEYRLHCRRRPDALEDEEEVYLDENAIAESPEYEQDTYFRIGFLKHSPNCEVLCFGVDTAGNERYTAHFMNLRTLEMYPDRIAGLYEGFEFANDSRTVYYTLLDEVERAYKVCRHVLGQPVSEDVLLYHETDEMFFLTLTKSSDGRYVIINSSAQITSETLYICADRPLDAPRILIPRREHIRYVVDVHEYHFYILTNAEAKNNRLVRVPLPAAGNPISEPLPPSSSQSWPELEQQEEEVVEHRDFVLIEDVQFRKHHLIVFERTNCLQNVRIVDLLEPGFSNYHYISFSEIVYSLWPRSVDEEVADMTRAIQYDTNVLRFTYCSFIQPKQVLDYNMDTREMVVVHEETVGGSIPYDRSLYGSRRLFATGWDGTAVPVSIVYRRDLLGMNMTPAQTNPALLHAYGAYGVSVNPIFSHARLSLLDRGFIYAVAHVRGGCDMGQGWYEEGKLGKKPNTFFDFCSVAEHLVKEGYTSPEQLAIYGRSAGGLLIGAVINLRPDLFRAALTEVPFVDVINTMFDPTIPWTAFEYEEWGNPNDREIYDVMKTYCPYSNISGEGLARHAYPHLLVIGGMNDPRVAFFEPLKLVAKMRHEQRTWAARLREQESGAAGDGSTPAEERVILLRLDDVGHGGNSGRYSQFEDLAYEYAFLITSLRVPIRPIYGALDPSLIHHLDSVFTHYGAWGMEGGGMAELAVEAHAASEYASTMAAKKRAKDEAEEKEYQRKTKGDRSQNRMFQWLNNFF